jgi:hypothetical protein
MTTYFDEMTRGAYDKYVDIAHHRDRDLWFKHLKATDSGSRERIQRRMDKMNRGVENALSLKLRKKKS